MINIADKLRVLGFSLPPDPKANGAYRTWVIDNGLFMTSGQLRRNGDGVITGPITPETDLSKAKQAAQIAILRCLAAFDEAQLNGAAFQNAVSLKGFIFSTPEFADHSRILDAASDILISVFGEEGRHIRTAVGVAGLPANGLVELELTIRCRDEL